MTFLPQLVIILSAVTAVVIPVFTLFNEGDYLRWQISTPTFQTMWEEILILAACLAVSGFIPKKRSVKIILYSAITLVFAYIHSMLLPVLLAAAWFVVLCSFGSFTAGISAEIIIAAVLSIFGRCTPGMLWIITPAVSLLFNLAMRLFGYGTPAGNAFGRLRDAFAEENIFTLPAVLSLLVQVGRANWAIDYDSLWYGLRSTYVLAPNGSVFEDLGLVGMTYTYSKGYEILTLPLEGFKSLGYVPAFSIILFALGLSVTYRLALHLTGRKNARLAVIITACIPAMCTMSMSAKSDIITWVLQLMLMERFFELNRVLSPGPTEMPEEKTHGTKSPSLVFCEML